MSFGPFNIPKHVRKLSELRAKPLSEWPEDLVKSVKLDSRQSENPTVSIVLIAYNEEDGILPTLASLALNDIVDAEFIVVNNNSKDRTAEYAREIGAIVVDETQQGYAFARQAGLNAARGEVIVTGDADTIYSAEWASCLSRPLLKNPQVAVTYGIHVLLPENGKASAGLQFYQVAKWLSQRLKGIRRPHLNCGGASMAFRKSDAMAVGGYLSDAERGEDGKLAWLLSERGRIVRVGKRSARIYTSDRRTNLDGSLWKAFWIRFIGTMRYFTHYFKKQKEH